MTNRRTRGGGDALDDHWPSRRTAERLGGRVMRNFIICAARWHAGAAIDDAR